MSTIDHLIRQANRIALFFEAYPDKEQSMANIADHIRKFWAPSLRASMLDFLASHPDGSRNGLTLHSLAGEAIKKHAATLAPADKTPAP